MPGGQGGEDADERAARRRRGLAVGEGAEQRDAEVAARARSLAESCQGTRTPALALALAARPTPLTDREAEIGALAARGLANRGVAERLAVSVRTIDNHLPRIDGKLGIGTRDELPDALGR